MTSDSIRARPMIIDRRIAPAAPGVRAMPSTDAAMARDWAVAPAPAATPRTNAAPMTPQRTPVGATSVPCANAALAIITMKRANKTSFNLLIPISPFLESCEVIKVFSKSVLFNHRGSGDVDHRQHDEDEGLQE